ncbi:AEC family transporter [Sphaerochaeta sp. PS]|uniref:AEC family transporter n=1 Tax=Sphaerochaeta sp. PS TaxID=3076336 RepID=UPI0028A57DE4|nr:AEC family transporter [Sphaerochaeta sp. PS]MDT4761980.1 permease [Sphaerochaeta sp. PS]
MNSNLSQPLLFLSIILLANLLKRAKVFKESDAQVLSQITLNITLPAAIVAGFSSFRMDSSLFLLILFGILTNVILMGLAYLALRKESKDMQAFGLFNASTYNIGNFSFPFVQTLFGGPGLVAAALFDLGNALMTTGLVYSVGTSLATNKKQSIRDILKKLLSSMPFITYLVMITLALADIHLPPFLTQWMDAIGKANPIVAMLMIGMMLEIRFEKGWLKQAMKVIAIRYLCAALFSVLVWNLTSFSPMVKVTLALLFFSPVSSVATAYTQRCTDKGKLSSFTSSVTVVLSTLSFLILVPLLNA